MRWLRRILDGKGGEPLAAFARELTDAAGRRGTAPRG